MKSSNINELIPLKVATFNAVRTFTRGRKCPRCTGRIRKGWLYCRNSINHWRNLCGWKPGRSTLRKFNERYCREIIQVVGPEQKGTTYQPYREEYEDSDRA